MICKYEPCSLPFEPKTPHQLFCRTLCKKRYHNSLKNKPLKVVECETKGYKEKFKQGNHLHKHCSECAIERKRAYQRNRYKQKKAGTWSKKKKKVKVVFSKAVICPWERGDIKPVKYGGML